MSIYDTIQRIEQLTNVKHSIAPDKVIARFYTNGKVINYYFNEYNKTVLEHHLGFDYDKMEVSYQFWDPSLCGAGMLMLEDIEYFETLDVFRGEVSWNAAAGFVLSLIGLYNIIAQSYSSENFDRIVDSINFDKEILRKVFRQVDIVVSMPESLLSFIKNIFSEDILDTMVTPSKQFRFTLADMDTIALNTPFTHEISTMIDRHIADDLTKLHYYVELLKVCAQIEMPYEVIDLSDQNIMFNICKLNIDIGQHYPLVQDAVEMYYEKGGTFLSIDPRQGQRYPNFSIIMRTFRNLGSISSGDTI